MSHLWGYSAALSSAFLFGISITINKILLESMPPLVIASVTYLVAGAFLGCMAILPKNPDALSRLSLPSVTTEPTRKNNILLVLTALFGGVLAPSLSLIGLDKTTAVSAALLGNTEALFTIMIAFIFLSERGSFKDYAAISLLIIGAFILTTNLSFQQVNTEGTLLGNVLIVSSAFFWGIDSNLSRSLTSKMSLTRLGSVKGIIGGGLLFAVASLYGIRFVPTISAITLLLIMGVFSVGLCLLFFLFSLQQIGAMRTGVIFSTGSLFGAVFAFFVLHEPISLLQLVAGCLMLFAIYILSIPKKDELSMSAARSLS